MRMLTVRYLAAHTFLLTELGKHDVSRHINLHNAPQAFYPERTEQHHRRARILHREVGPQAFPNRLALSCVRAEVSQNCASVSTAARPPARSPRWHALSSSSGCGVPKLCYSA
jgi:hypothetical protein